MELVLGFVGPIEQDNLASALKKASVFCGKPVEPLFKSSSFSLYASRSHTEHIHIYQNEKAITLVQGKVFSNQNDPIAPGVFDLSKIQGPYSAIQWNQVTEKLSIKITHSSWSYIYFAHLGDSFVFSNLLPLPDLLLGRRHKINELKIISRLEGRYDILNESYYDDVAMVSPGDILSFKERISRTEIPLKMTHEKKIMTYQDAVHSSKDLISSVTGKYIKNGNNIASTLSGGLDSTTISAFAALQMKSENKILHTYSHVPSIGFNSIPRKNRILDESPFIKELISMYSNMEGKFITPDMHPFSLTDIAKYLVSIGSGPCAVPMSYPWMSTIFSHAGRENRDSIFISAYGNALMSWNYGNSKKMGFYKSYIKPSLSYGKRMLTRMHKEPLSGSLWKINPKSVLDIKSEFDNISHLSSFLLYKQAFTFSGDILNALQIRNSITAFDPSANEAMIKHFLSIPEQLYTNNGISRSIIRGSTQGILPESIRMNFMRGEQSPEWFCELKKSIEVYKKRLSLYKDIPFLNQNMDFKKASKLLSILSGLQITHKNNMSVNYTFDMVANQLQYADWVLFAN